MSGTSRGRRCSGFVAALLVVALGGCSGGGPVGSTSPASSPPGSTKAQKPKAAPSSTPAPRPTPSPSPAVWTGTFHGHSITIPEGHGAPISFTFDDGPSPTYTPQVLALLKKNRVPAVFCLIGNEARAYPYLVRQEVRAGHQLCDHSRDHDLNMNNRGKAYVRGEVDDGLAEIRSAAPGAPVSYYRQPGGYWSPAVVKAMNHDQLYPLRWSDDPKDWSRPGSTRIVRRVVKHVHPGAVILMHDGGGDRSQTVKALTWLLQALPAAGWQPVVAPRKHLSAKAAAQQQ